MTPDGRKIYVSARWAGGPGLGQGAVASVTTATDTCHPGFAVGEDPAAIAARDGQAPARHRGQGAWC